MFRALKVLANSCKQKIIFHCCALKFLTTIQNRVLRKTGLLKLFCALEHSKQCEYKCIRIIQATGQVFWLYLTPYPEEGRFAPLYRKHPVSTLFRHIVSQVVNMGTTCWSPLPSQLDSRTGPAPSHRWGSAIKHRHTTLGRTPLEELSARRRDRYLTTYNTHNGQTFMLSAEFEPVIPACERPQNQALDRVATWIGDCWISVVNQCAVHCHGCSKP
jgi:hypothetical protein